MATKFRRIEDEEDRGGFTRDGKNVRWDTERLIGLVDVDGDQLVLVETEENGTVRGRLPPEGCIRLLQSQRRGGDSVVMMTTPSPVAH